MSAEILRRAAALMRDRAEAATEGRWEAHEETPSPLLPEWAVWSPDAGHDFALTETEANAAHIASWHPAVALAVADLLDGTAKWLLPCEEPCWERGIEGCPDCEVYGPALAVARAYLGSGS